VRYGANKGDCYFASTFGNIIYASTDATKTWTRVYPSLSVGLGGGGQTLISLHPTEDGKVYLSEGMSIFVSTANGTGGFTNLAPIIPIPHGSGMGQLTNILIHPSTPSVMFAGIAQQNNTTTVGNYLVKSMDSGAHWSAVPGLTSHGVSLLAFDPSNPDIIYANCGSGCGSRPFNGIGDGLFKSADGGTTWTKIGAGIFEKGYLETFAFDPLDTATLFTGGVYSDRGDGVMDAVHISTDSGRHWKTLLMNGSSIGSSKVFYYGSSLYLGNSEGYLYKSDDKGKAWGVAMMMPSMIEWVFSDTGTVSGSAPLYRASGLASVYVGSQSGLLHVTGMGAASGITGGYGNPLSSGVLGEGDSRPYAGSDVKLFSYPNPFDPSRGVPMTIRLGIGRDASRVTVRLYSLSGELVLDADASSRTGGTFYGFTWNGTNQKGERVAPPLKIKGRELAHRPRIDQLGNPDVALHAQRQGSLQIDWQ
jgi:hypothetical protein